MNHSQAGRIATRVLIAVLALMLLLASLPSIVFSQQPPPPHPQSNADPGPGPQSGAPAPQTTQPHIAVHKMKRMDCPHAADPHRLHNRCKDEDFDWDETLSGTWAGMRAHLRELGISATLSYGGALQTNVSGKTHQIWSYAGQLTGGLNVDFEKLLKIKGMSVYVGGSWGTGDNLNGSLDNLFPVNPFYAPDYYLGEMYLQQTLLDQKLALVGGRIAASNTFATLPVLANYVNYGLNPNPYSLGGNDVTFFAPPAGTEWGAQATYDVTPVLQVAAGLFNTNVNSANGQNHGTDWTLQQGNKGALAVAEVSYFPHGIVSDQGKQGLYTVGVISDNNSFPTLANEETRTTGYIGAFVLAQETIYQPDGPNTSRGLTVWGSWAYNAKPLISPIPLFWAAGASYQGLFQRRKNDAASAGWIYGQVSNSIPDTTAEQVLELNYRWQCRRFLAITPDFQYIWNPGGHSVPGVTVIGIQASVTF